MKITPLNVALAAAFIPFCAFAQDQVPELEPIVVTASRTAEPLKNVVGDFTVIEQEQLQRETSPTLLGLLARTPGLQVYDNGGPQMVNGLFTRGGESRHTLVMLNGIKLNSSINGSVPWNLLNPTLFNQVEIVRGAASSLYGSSAVAGVINLITTPTHTNLQDLSLRANIGGGSNGTFKANASISGATEKFDYYLAGAYATSDGYNATRPYVAWGQYNLDTDSYEQSSVIGSLGYTFTPGHRLGVTFFNSYLNGDYDAGFTNPNENTHFLDRQNTFAITSTNQFSDFWTSNLSYSDSKHTNDNRISNPGVFTSHTKTFSWQNDFHLNQNQTISLLLEHQQEDIDKSIQVDSWGTTPNYDVTNRKTNSVALIYQGHFNRHHLQASIRRDVIKGNSNYNTGSIAYAFDITQNLQASIGLNNAFRLPDFNNLYWPGWSNPNLKAEKARNIDFNLRYSDDNTTATVSLFETRYRDLISANTNIDKARSQGLSLDFSHRLGNTTLSAGADFLSAKNQKTGERLILRSKQTYRASISHEFERVTIGADYLFIGNRTDLNRNTNKVIRLGGYGLVNLRADYKVAKNFQIQASVNNVFNKKYEPAYGYNGQGTNFFLNLSYQH